MSDVQELHIHLSGRRIGSLTLIQGDRSILTFDQDYIDDPDRPTLSLSFKDSLGGLLTDFRPMRMQVEPFFSNLLPEGPLRRYLAERAGVKEVREFFLLWALGIDLPGAVTLRPADEGSWLSETAIEDSRAKDRTDHALRFSLAGVQLKFSAFRNDGKSGGLVIPAKGAGGSWIVKLPADRFEGVPENEFAMMTLARQIGIDVPEIDLIDVSEIKGLPDGLGVIKGKAFVIRRFDRSDNGPVHIEDFAQVFGVHPDDKYKKASYRSIAHVLQVETGEQSVAEFIRRLVFSTLIGNADMHLKNWSLIYPDGRTPMLSPAYDLLSTIPYIPDQTAALKYARTRKMSEFTYDELSYLAAKAGVADKLVRQTADRTVEEFHETWAREKNHLGLADAVIDAIDKHLLTLPLVSGR
ncbi:MAG TPA: HipA domain-containing protein [Skermanella sp.]|jgi:serine/threonine-protein kinase HipA|nr:HipA domain-containing protein [Skermanella sp.]